MANPPERKTVRRRSLPVKTSSGKCVTDWQSRAANGTLTNGSSSGNTSFSAWRGTQVTESTSHPNWNLFRKRGKFQGDVGGDFFSQRQYCESDIPSQKASGTVYTSPTVWTSAQRRGPILPVSPTSGQMPALQAASSNAVLNARGAQAISRCKPTNSIADGATFLGEILREGIPTRNPHAFKLLTEDWRLKTEQALKRPAKDFLEAEYGWAPIANDISKFARAVAAFDTAIQQWERDRGRLVRRRYEFPPVESVSSSKQLVGNAAYAPFDNAALYVTPAPQDAYVSFLTEVGTRQWFSGAFTYFVPAPSQGWVDATFKHQAKKIFGLQLTPETIWNLAPWSWAVDWFTNVGDVIANLSDWINDGLVMQYGYMMEYKYSRITYTPVGPSMFRSGNRPTQVSLVSETKTRRRASPFGFGLTWNGLSPKQLAIAASLGITKW